MERAPAAPAGEAPATAPADSANRRSPGCTSSWQLRQPAMFTALGREPGSSEVRSNVETSSATSLRRPGGGCAGGWGWCGQHHNGRLWHPYPSRASSARAARAAPDPAHQLRLRSIGVPPPARCDAGCAPLVAPPRRPRTRPGGRPTSARSVEDDHMRRFAPGRPVVADDHQRSRPLVGEVLELTEGVEVPELVGRLVQQQDVRMLRQDEQQLEVGDARRPRGARSAPTGRRRRTRTSRAARRRPSRLRGAAGDGVPDPHPGVELTADLVVVADPGVAAGFTPARCRLDPPGHDVEQRRLAGPVGRSRPPSRSADRAAGRCRRTARCRPRSGRPRAARRRGRPGAGSGSAGAAHRGGPRPGPDPRRCGWRPRCAPWAWRCGPERRASSRTNSTRARLRRVLSSRAACSSRKALPSR